MDVQQAYTRLLEHLGEIDDLQRAAAVLSWDRQTNMPPRGSATRSRQAATLGRIAHERFTSEETGRLLAAVEEWAAGLPYDSDEASLVRVTKRRYALQSSLSPKLVETLSIAGAQGFDAWLEARATRSFRPFRDAFARLVELRKEEADALAEACGAACRYDALLQRHEPGMTVAQLDRLFGRLKEVLVPLVRRIAERQELVSDAILHQRYDESRQWELTLEALRLIGFDFTSGRQDRSVHPFTTGFGPGDTRLTTRIFADHLGGGLFASLHEGGHGLYDQGVPARFARTPLYGGTSGGVHESQSRLWENVVGRSREFWSFFLPKARALFPEQLRGVTVEVMYRAVNRSTPSLIRVDADEVTYNLHIMVRYELERDLLDGDLPVDDLPEAWNRKMEAYLGVTPPDDLHGLLQDIHWSRGGFAGFPGYTLGNVISLQLYERACQDRPDIPESIRRGDTSPLLEWMRTHVHAHGAKFTPEELLQRATGRGLDPEPYLNYITRKFSELYEL
ncbi:MAG: carboxypeptidase M32 [Firmicutes bacterium]|nr:carboxypeptidase M32 [Bacillota bacterium]